MIERQQRERFGYIGEEDFKPRQRVERKERGPLLARIRIETVEGFVRVRRESTVVEEPVGKHKNVCYNLPDIAPIMGKNNKNTN